MTTKTQNTPKGMRFIYGEEAEKMNTIIRYLEDEVSEAGYKRLILPAVWSQKTFIEKAGPEIVGQMYSFNDRSDRPICLAPEGTAIVREWYKENFQKQRTINVFYTQKFYRYEQPQAGRYREFTQFGVESLGPKQENTLQLLKALLVEFNGITFDDAAKRGLDYYIADGFEARCESLGAQKQVAGGGAYDVGQGFAIGVDRLCLVPGNFES